MGPSLSYDSGTFYLVYTDVKTWTNPAKDSHNYLVSTRTAGNGSSR